MLRARPNGGINLGVTKPTQTGEGGAFDPSKADEILLRFAERERKVRSRYARAGYAMLALYVALAIALGVMVFVLHPEGHHSSLKKELGTLGHYIQVAGIGFAISLAAVFLGIRRGKRIYERFLRELGTIDTAPFVESMKHFGITRFESLPEHFRHLKKLPGVKHFQSYVSKRVDQKIDSKALLFWRRGIVSSFEINLLMLLSAAIILVGFVFLVRDAEFGSKYFMIYIFCVSLLFYVWYPTMCFVSRYKEEIYEAVRASVGASAGQ